MLSAAVAMEVAEVVASMVAVDSVAADFTVGDSLAEGSTAADTAGIAVESEDIAGAVDMAALAVATPGGALVVACGVIREPAAALEALADGHGAAQSPTPQFVMDSGIRSEQPVLRPPE